MEPQLGHLPAAKHFHCSTETLPILLSLMRETAAAPGLVTQEPGKNVAWGALSSPPVMHAGQQHNAGQIYNVGGYPVQMSARTNTGHMLGSRISGACHPPTQRFLWARLDDLQDSGLGGFVDLL